MTEDVEVVIGRLEKLLPGSSATAAEIVREGIAALVAQRAQLADALSHITALEHDRQSLIDAATAHRAFASRAAHREADAVRGLDAARATIAEADARLHAASIPLGMSELAFAEATIRDVHAILSAAQQGATSPWGPTRAFAADAILEGVQETAEPSDERPGMCAICGAPRSHCGGHPGTEERPLTLRPIPEQPTDQMLEQMASDAIMSHWGGDVIAIANADQSEVDAVGYGAIWRHGCDTGMVAP